MTPADIACRKCDEQPNSPCVEGWPDKHPFTVDGRPAFRSERIEDVALCSGNGESRLSKEDFDRAVVDSGLV